MESGMFTAHCPTCHAELEVLGDGDEYCPRCGTTFVQRFGWLIPRERRTTTPAEPAEPT
jgi:uncharacterized Zn finger protein (UPF0148 family)